MALPDASRADRMVAAKGGLLDHGSDPRVLHRL